MRGLVKGKRWLLLTRWVNLSAGKRQELNQLFAMNRKVFKAYLLKESLDRLWTYRYEGAMLNYLQRWIDQLRWQRLTPFQKLAMMLLDHLDGILNYCRTKVPLGVVEAINGNIKSLLRRGRGYKNLRYLLLKAQRMAATRTEFVALQESGLKCSFRQILAQSRSSFHHSRHVVALFQFAPHKMRMAALEREPSPDRGEKWISSTAVYTTTPSKDQAKADGFTRPPRHRQERW